MDNSGEYLFPACAIDSRKWWFHAVFESIDSLNQYKEIPPVESCFINKSVKTDSMAS